MAPMGTTMDRDFAIVQNRPKANLKANIIAPVEWTPLPIFGTVWYDDFDLKPEIALDFSEIEVALRIR